LAAKREKNRDSSRELSVHASWESPFSYQWLVVTVGESEFLEALMPLNV